MTSDAGVATAHAGPSPPPVSKACQTAASGRLLRSNSADSIAFRRSTAEQVASRAIAKAQFENLSQSTGEYDLRVGETFEMNYGSVALFSVSGPPIVPPPAGSVRAGQYLKGFRPLITKLGGEWSRVLADNDIDCGIIRDFDRPLPWTSATALLEYCSLKFHDQVFGLHLAEHQNADVYGCVAAMAHAAPTMRDGIQCIIDFVPLFHSPGAAAELVAGRHAAELRWMPSPDFSIYEQANHHGLLLAVKLLRSIAGPGFRASYATSVSGLHRCRPQIEASLGCEVRPNSFHDAIAFSVDQLDWPRDASNPILFALIGSYLSQLRRREHFSVIEKAEAYVSMTLQTPRCTISHCARSIAMSVRTLQKRLADAGTSFSRIVDERRLVAAKIALADTAVSLDDVAESVGYSEKSALSRAFKRASGMTPHEFRTLCQSDPHFFERAPNDLH